MGSEHPLTKTVRQNLDQMSRKAPSVLPRRRSRRYSRPGPSHS
jgi:hypothetical protein